MAREELFDWRGYPKGTFFSLSTRSNAYAIVNKKYIFSLSSHKNTRVNMGMIKAKDVTVLGYVPRDFLK